MTSSPHSVLLVDDDALQLRVRQAVLHDAGFAVEIATSADGALGILRAERDPGFSAIITDHLLPGTTGAELVRQIRQVLPAVPVIVITGLPDAEMDYTGLNVHFRNKPLPPPELIALLRNVTQLTD